VRSPQTSLCRAVEVRRLDVDTHGSPIHDFRGAWQRACRDAGMPGRLVHDLRRTAVRKLERAGVSRSDAIAMTGHKTESVYRRYAIAALKLSALHASDKAKSDTKEAQSRRARSQSSEKALYFQPNPLGA
jgi:integrase